MDEEGFAFANGGLCGELEIVAQMQNPYIWIRDTKSIHFFLFPFSFLLFP